MSTAQRARRDHGSRASGEVGGSPGSASLGSTSSIAASRSGRTRPSSRSSRRRSVRIALADPDQAIEPVVAGTRPRRVVTPSPASCRTGDPERVAQSEVQDLVGAAEGHPASTHGRASTARGWPPTAARRPNRTGSSRRQPGLRGGLLDDPASLVVVGVERGVERDRDDLRRRDEPGHPLVQPDERRQRRDRERGLGRWSKSWSARPGLWTMTIACGVAPWMSPSVTDVYAGWSSEPWPSTMTQSPRPSPSSISHSTVPWRSR